MIIAIEPLLSTKHAPATCKQGDTFKFAPLKDISKVKTWLTERIECVGLINDKLAQIFSMICMYRECLQAIRDFVRNRPRGVIKDFFSKEGDVALYTKVVFIKLGISPDQVKKYFAAVKDMDDGNFDTLKAACKASPDELLTAKSKTSYTKTWNDAATAFNNDLGNDVEIPVLPSPAIGEAARNVNDNMPLRRELDEAKVKVFGPKFYKNNVLYRLKSSEGGLIIDLAASYPELLQGAPPSGRCSTLGDVITYLEANGARLLDPEAQRRSHIRGTATEINERIVICAFEETLEKVLPRDTWYDLARAVEDFGREEMKRSNTENSLPEWVITKITENMSGFSKEQVGRVCKTLTTAAPDAITNNRWDLLFGSVISWTSIHKTSASEHQPSDGARQSKFEEMLKQFEHSLGIYIGDFRTGMYVVPGGPLDILINLTITNAHHESRRFENLAASIAKALGWASEISRYFAVLVNCYFNLFEGGHLNTNESDLPQLLGRVLNSENIRNAHTLKEVIMKTPVVRDLFYLLLAGSWLSSEYVAVSARCSEHFDTISEIAVGVSNSVRVVAAYLDCINDRVITDRDALRPDLSVLRKYCDWKGTVPGLPMHSTDQLFALREVPFEYGLLSYKEIINNKGNAAVIEAHQGRYYDLYFRQSNTVTWLNKTLSNSKPCVLRPAQPVTTYSHAGGALTAINSNNGWPLNNNHNNQGRNKKKNHRNNNNNNPSDGYRNNNNNRRFNRNNNNNNNLTNNSGSHNNNNNTAATATTTPATPATSVAGSRRERDGNPTVGENHHTCDNHIVSNKDDLAKAQGYVGIHTTEQCKLNDEGIVQNFSRGNFFVDLEKTNAKRTTMGLSTISKEDAVAKVKASRARG